MRTTILSLFSLLIFSSNISAHFHEPSWSTISTISSVSKSKKFKRYSSFLNYTFLKSLKNADSANSFYKKDFKESLENYTDPWLLLTGGTLTGALSGTTGTFSGNLAVGTTSAGWGGSFAGMMDFNGGSIGGSSASDFRVWSNLFYDGYGYKLRAGGSATMLLLGGGAYTFYTAPTGAANATATLTNQMTLDNTGLTVTAAVSGGAASFTTGKFSGNVSLGTSTPAWGSFTNMLDFPGGSLGGQSTSDFRIWSNMFYDGGSYKLRTNGSGGFQYMGAGTISWYTASAGSAGSTASLTMRMIIDSSGLKVPGNINANGIVKAKKLTITQLGWSDYVFNDNYRLRSLYDLESFIKRNKHLPEVPSAKEVEANGISVGDTQALMLKKIEELTLYIIDLKKESDKQDMHIRYQSKMIEQLKMRKK